MTDERERMGFEFSFNADTEDDFIRAVMAALRGINNSYPHGVQFTDRGNEPSLPLIDYGQYVMDSRKSSGS
jgi:hypothetical protein